MSLYLLIPSISAPPHPQLHLFLMREFFQSPDYLGYKYTDDRQQWRITTKATQNFSSLFPGIYPNPNWGLRIYASFFMCVKVKVAQSCLTLCDSMDYAWNSPGQNTGVGSLSLLQGMFPTQGLNPGLPHCRQILYTLSHKGSPRTLQSVAHTDWANREAFFCVYLYSFQISW